MYPAKTPQITQLLERRIRQNIYSDRIPPTRTLATEFGVARQTMTDALKPLVQSGLLKNCRRQGLTIDRDQLKSGKVYIVSLLKNPQHLAELTDFARIVEQDNWTLELLPPLPPHELAQQLADDTLGVIFASSSLTVENAEYLQARQIPFISCNQLPGYRNINWVDFDIAHSLRALLTPIAQKGYKHVGVILYGHIENFNDMLRRELLKIKRELNLCHDQYDDAVVYWDVDLEQRLQQSLRFFQQKESYPEVLISFAQLTAQQCRQIQELPHPPELIITESLPENNIQMPGVKCFKSVISSQEILRQGYELLRCAIFTPGMYPIQIALKQQHLFYDKF